MTKHWTTLKVHFLNQEVSAEEVKILGEEGVNPVDVNEEGLVGEVVAANKNTIQT